METATRWKQGLESFCAGLTLLQQGRKPGPTVLNRLEVEGVIHRFEYTLDLAWKVARDFLEESGLRIAPRTPREVLRQAAAAQIVDDGQVWIDMLNHRTLLAHNYGGVVFNEVAEALTTRYLPAMEQLHRFLAQRSRDEPAAASGAETC